MFALVVAVLPLTGFAQQTRQISPVQQASAMLQGVTSDQAMAIGVGVIGGAIGLHALLGGAAWTVGGAVVGAMFGDWWYLQHSGQGFARKGATATLAAK